MAISTVGSPDAFSPAYNPIWYYFDSTNKNLTGFRYVVDLYDGSGTPSLLHRFKIAPRPTDGYGALNISRILSNYLESTFALAQFVDYDLHIGEEYSTDWDYDTTGSYVDTAGAGLYSGYYYLQDSAMAAHTYSVGDQIDITQDTVVTNTSLTGLHTIVAIPNDATATYTIVIDVLYTTAVTNSGTTIYADGRKTVYPDLLTLTNKIAFQGAIHHEEYRTYTSTQYDLSTGTPGSAVSYHPAVKTTRDGELFALNFKGATWSYVYAENDRGDVWRKAVSPTNPTQQVRMDMTWILANLNVQTAGTGPIIDSAVDWYKVWVADSSGDRISQEYRFNINRDCTNYQEMHASFADRLGSVGAFSFWTKSDKNLKISREEHTFMFGNLSGSAWTYATTDFGQRFINANLETTYTVRTQWLSDEEAVYFQELITSGLVVLDYGYGLFPVVCQTNSVKVVQRPADKNLKYEVTFKLANNEIINI